MTVMKFIGGIIMIGSLVSILLFIKGFSPLFGMLFFALWFYGATIAEDRWAVKT